MPKRLYRYRTEVIATVFFLFQDAESARVMWHVTTPEHPLYRLGQGILYCNQARPRRLYNMAHVKALSVEWFRACVQTFSIQGDTQQQSGPDQMYRVSLYYGTPYRVYHISVYNLQTFNSRVMQPQTSNVTVFLFLFV